MACPMSYGSVFAFGAEKGDQSTRLLKRDGVGSTIVRLGVLFFLHVLHGADDGEE